MRAIREFASEAPLLFTIALFIAVNLAVVLFYVPGQTLWAFLASFQIAVQGTAATGVVEEVDFNEVQASLSQIEGVYTTTISHEGAVRSFNTSEPIAEPGESVALVAIAGAPRVFVPAVEDQDFWARVQLLADVSIVKGMRPIVTHLLMSAVVLGAAAFGIGRFAIVTAVPWIGAFCVRQDRRFRSFRARVTPWLEGLRGILFVFLYVALLSIVFLEVSRQYLELALRAERLTALAAVGFLCLGIPFLAGVYFLFRSIRRQELLPNLQVTLAAVLALVALGRGLYSSAEGLYIRFVGGESALGSLLLEILEQLLGL